MTDATNILYYPAVYLWIVGNEYLFENFDTDELISHYNTLMIIALVTVPILNGIFFTRPYYIAVQSYLMFAYFIMNWGKSKNWIMLSFPLIIFYSEYYEIPIYIYRLIFGSPHPISLFIVSVKLLMIIVVDEMIKAYDWDDYYLFRHLTRFLIIYIPFGVLIVTTSRFNGYLSPLILKFICLIDFKLNILKQVENNGNN